MARRRRTPPSSRRDDTSEITEGTSPEGAGISAVGLPALVQQEIDQELSALDPQLGPQTRTRVRRLVVRIAHEVAEFSGPLPPPSYLSEYDAILPGAADRIISMAEAEQKHRHSWERSALNNTTVGLWFGFLIALGLVGGGVYSVYAGQPYVAGGFLTAGAIGMVPALIRGKDFIVQRHRDGVDERTGRGAPKQRQR
jgi:uncharacterized membrane protein